MAIITLTPGARFLQIDWEIPATPAPFPGGDGFPNDALGRLLRDPGAVIREGDASLNDMLPTLLFRYNWADKAPPAHSLMAQAAAESNLVLLSGPEVCAWSVDKTDVEGFQPGKIVEVGLSESWAYAHYELSKEIPQRNYALYRTAFNPGELLRALQTAAVTVVDPRGGSAPAGFAFPIDQPVELLYQPSLSIGGAACSKIVGLYNSDGIFIGYQIIYIPW